MSAIKRAMIVGSFDPLHNGHRFLIEKAGKIFDEVWVVISINVNKTPQSTLDQRYQTLQQQLANYSFVQVQKNANLLTAEYAKKHDIHFLVRGIRNKKDYLYEEKLAQANQHLNPGLQTLFFFADDAHKKLSSSAIKEIEKFKKEYQNESNK